MSDAPKTDVPKYHALYARLARGESPVSLIDTLIAAIEAFAPGAKEWTGDADEAEEELGSYTVDSGDPGTAWSDPAQPDYESFDDEDAYKAAEDAYESGPGRKYAAAVKAEESAANKASALFDELQLALFASDGLHLKEWLSALKARRKAWLKLASKMPPLAGGYRP